MVSVIIPIYKVEKYVEASLRSVINQSYKDIELVLVDDCSPDRSMEVVKRVLCESNFPSERVRLLSLSKNGGLSNARNQGLLVAQGEFVFFMDSDDTISKDCIDIHVKAITEAGADFTDANIKMIGAKNIFSPYVKEKYIESRDNILKSFFTEIHVSACNKLIRKCVLIDNKIQFTSGVLYEDMIWSYSLCFVANSYVQLSDYTYSYIIRSGSITTNKSLSNIVYQFDSLRITISLFIQQFDLLQNFKFEEERKKWFGKFCFKVKARFLNHIVSQDYRKEYLCFLSSRQVTKFVSPIYRVLLICPFPIFALFFKLPDKIYRNLKQR